MNISLQHGAQELDSVIAPDGTVPPGSAGALAGALAAAILSSACGTALEDCKSERTAEELRDIRDKALSLRRDLLALLEHGAQAALKVAAARGAMGVAGRPEAERLRALLFASEVPLRTAESCLALLNLSLRALGRIGVKAIAEIGTAAALAFSGVVGGIVTARTYLAGIPLGAGIGAAVTRKRAERIFREAESIRTQIIDRVRQHLP
jgi:formiminotetrahydrofolate cyclodeaminase